MSGVEVCYYVGRSIDIGDGKYEGSPQVDAFGPGYITEGGSYDGSSCGDIS